MGPCEYRLNAYSPEDDWDRFDRDLEEHLEAEHFRRAEEQYQLDTPE